jgi:hypothetical protein
MTTHDHSEVQRPARVRRRGRLFLWLAIVVDIPLLIAFSTTQLPGWVGAVTTAFTLTCGALYITAERPNL